MALTDPGGPNWGSGLGARLLEIQLEIVPGGPNIDGVETRDERALLPGIGFSIEPGVYFDGEFEKLDTPIDIPLFQRPVSQE